jgi:hypothetical protein
VKQVQQRLTDLGFAPGPVDGQFGGGTQQAVWAYKKLIGGLTFQQLAASDNASAVDNELWQQMQDPIVIQPRRPMGAGRRHVEIYLPLQVMVVFTDDKPTLVTHIASGELDASGQPMYWCEKTTYDTDADGSPLPEPVVKQECAYSKTPGGIFRFRRKVEGNRVGPLGGMYNPVYFNYGIAVHGAKDVPREPASHGCIRINMDIAEYFPDLVKVGDAVYVWGHDGKEPEGYTRNESLPSFNQPDPNAIDHHHIDHHNGEGHHHGARHHGAGAHHHEAARHHHYHHHHDHDHHGTARLIGARLDRVGTVPDLAA